MNFEELRNKYKNFIYKDYKIYDLEDRICLEYTFEIENLKKFTPRIEVLKKEFKFNDIDSLLVQNIVFNIGMIEAISYYKAVCSENFTIECGAIDSYQEKWFRKLFYLGLGEFRYINNIKIDENEFIKFKSLGNKIEISKSENRLSGNIIPIGGGKDSNVTLELLEKYKENNLAFCIGSKRVSLDCAKAAGYKDNQIIEVKRIIDKNLLDLNKEGYLNGHTPFSAYVAFTSYYMAYLTGKKYITLSNENSANDSTVIGTKINHQYSKTYEFENDFNNYTLKYFGCDIKYFSFLRPLSEIQIAMLISQYKKYHSIFKSCNVGSKQNPWVWCCDCAKCLFVYIILSPFLYKDELVNIFGVDLYEKESLLKLFKELIGDADAKPFECVGTIKEVRFSLSYLINKLDKNNLPYLLKYFYENYELSDTNESLLTEFNNENNLPLEFVDLLKEE